MTMTPEQIEQWAREAGGSLLNSGEAWAFWNAELTRFAELVAQSAAQAERWRCALVAKNYPRADEWIAEEIAAAILNSKQGGE